jgi:polyisoprenoid-binding protein YceI
MNRYAIDPGRSRFTVQAFATGLLSAFAHSPTFAVRGYRGEVRLGSTAESLELELDVNPDSLDLEDRVRDADRREIEARMRDEVLETSRHRTLGYRGRAVRAETIGQGRYRLALAGDLTLRGTTRPHPIDAELIVFDDGLRLGGTSTLRMSEYGIQPVTALGGTIKLKDELRFSFDLAALPQAS